jgi:hypothetical protein
MQIHGRCHCGNIAFALRWAPDPGRIPARACDCSFCTRHGAVWTANPQGRLHIEVREAAKVSRYAFGTRTAEFLVCARCGVVPAALSRIDGNLYAVVNVQCFEGVDPALLQHTVAHFGEEDPRVRLDRRKAHWIGDVECAGLDAGSSLSA